MSRPALSLALSFLLMSPALAGDLPPGAVARLGGTAFRHPDRPTCLALSPDGKALVSGGTDGTLRVWDPLTGCETRRLAVPDAVVIAAAFSTDGRVFAAHVGGKVLQFDAATFRPVRDVPCDGVDALALSRNGELIGAVRSNGSLALLEATTGLDRMELPNGRSLAFTPDGSAVAASDAADRVTVYEIPSGKPRVTIRHPNRDGVTAVAFNPDGSKLATSDPGDTGRVRLWDAETGKMLAEWPGEGPLAFRADGSLVGRRGGTVVIWNVKSGKPVREIDAGAWGFAVSASGKWLATAGDRARLRVWDLDSGREHIPPGVDPVEVRSLSAMPDRGRVILGTPAGVMQWAPGESRTRPLLPGRVGPAMTFDRWLVAPHGRGVGVWELLPDRELPLEPLRIFNGGVFDRAAGTADGRLLAVVTDGRTISIADLGAGKVLRSWSAPSPVLGLVLTPFDDRLIAVGRDGFVRCWDLTGPTSEEPPPEAWKARIPRSLNAAVATPDDGRFVAVASVLHVTLFDMASGKPIHVYERKWDDGPFRSVVVSPDGRLVAAGTLESGGRIVVWEVATRTIVRKFVSGSGTVEHVAFLDGGRRVVSAGHDDTVLVWNLTDRPDRSAPTDAVLRTAWDVLDRDGDVGWPAVWALADGGPRGLAVIREGLTRAGETGERVKALIKQLDADSFAVREAAAAGLKALGVQSLPGLTEAAVSYPSAEVRQRAERIVTDLARSGLVIPAHGLYGETLRQVRAVAALEAIGGMEATELLEQLRAHGGRPGEEADRALKRAAARM
jgi:WD40 repeat protein